MIKSLFLASSFLLVLPSICWSQPTELKHTRGDSTLKASIAPTIREIYELEGQRVFQLTRENVYQLQGIHATELYGLHTDERFRRIVATSWMETGKYSVEFYWDENSLVFTYETFEYFAESSPPSSWRNFKGIAAWERRSYYTNGRAGYTETTGNADLEGIGVQQLVASSDRVRDVLKEKLEQAN